MCSPEENFPFSDFNGSTSQKSTRRSVGIKKGRVTAQAKSVKSLSAHQDMLSPCDEHKQKSLSLQKPCLHEHCNTDGKTNDQARCQIRTQIVFLCF